MNKKNIFRTLSVAAFSAVMFTSCNNSAPKMDEKQDAAQPAGTTDMKIAFVEVDSIMSQYKFWKEYSIELEKKSNNARNTLSATEKQNNGFSSRQEAESVQAAIQRQGQALHDLQHRLGSELDTETAKFNAALRDSIQNFLKDYNKTKKYDLIISKAGDNILYADKRHDITMDVINGLNNRYKAKVEKK